MFEGFCFPFQQVRYMYAWLDIMLKCWLFIHKALFRNTLICIFSNLIKASWLLHCTEPYTKCLNENYWEALSIHHTFLTFPFILWYTFSSGWPMCDCYVLTPHDDCKGMSQSLWVIFSLTESSSSRNPWTSHHLIKLVAMESPCPVLPLTSHFGK